MGRGEEPWAGTPLVYEAPSISCTPRGPSDGHLAPSGCGAPTTADMKVWITDLTGPMYLVCGEMQEFSARRLGQDDLRRQLLVV